MSKHNIPISISKRKSPEIIPNTIVFVSMEFIYGLKNEIETAVVNAEPSVFEPLKFYCKVIDTPPCFPFFIASNFYYLLGEDSFPKGIYSLKKDCSWSKSFNSRPPPSH